jgi:hypothetical protein
MLEEAEGDARYLLRGFDTTIAPGARSIVRAHLGPEAIVEAPGLPTEAMLSLDLEGRPVIFVRPRLPSQLFRWNVIHELVEWHVHVTGRMGEDQEDYVEMTTACMVVPRQALIRRVHQVGHDWGLLAVGFNTTETCVALRYFEVFGIAGAVDAPTKIRARGPERAWQVPETIRSISRGRLIVPGLKKAQLSDPRRVVIAEVDIDVA